MREKTVEQKLVRAVKAAGGICPKWVAPGFDGMPDRIVLLPDGRMGFVEVKAPGKKARPLQRSRHELLRSLGFRVYVLDNPEQIGGIIDEIRSMHRYLRFLPGLRSEAFSLRLLLMQEPLPIRLRP